MIYKVRQLLHLLFNWHWFTNVNIGVPDPKEHCEFCNETRDALEKCKKGKHKWKFVKETGCYFVIRHHVCVRCGVKGATDEIYVG